MEILVVDDHELVRMGIVRMLDDVAGFNVIGEAKTGEEAIAKCRDLKPDIVLIDIKMPGIGGIEATKKMVSIHASVKIIAVTAYDDNLYPERLIQAGAVGYVTKGAGFSEIVTAIKKVVRGDVYISENVAQQLALKNVSQDSNLSPFEKLSQRELQTAMMIASGQKAPDIANTFNVSSKTVNSYRYRIFEKLNINSDVELALLAVKYNFLDPNAVV